MPSNKSSKSPAVAESNTFQEEVLNQLQEFRKSLDYNSKMLEDVVQSNKNLQKELKDLREQNDQLAEENKQLKTQLAEIRSDVIDLQQYSRRMNIEIANFPETQNENLNVIMGNFMAALETDQMQDLVTYHRVPTMNKHKVKPIVVQFGSVITKNKFMKIAKQKKVSAEKINSSLCPQPIYFNDHLCPELKKLLYDCKQFKKNNDFKFCWNKGGKIFIRKHEGSQIYRIKSNIDLLNVPK